MKHIDPDDWPMLAFLIAIVIAGMAVAIALALVPGASIWS